MIGRTIGHATGDGTILDLILFLAATVGFVLLGLWREGII